MGHNQLLSLLFVHELHVLQLFMCYWAMDLESANIVWMPIDLHLFVCDVTLTCLASDGNVLVWRDFI